MRQILGATLLCVLFVPTLASARADIEQGKIFGIKIGERLSLSNNEQAQAAREFGGSFIRFTKEKPDDVTALQVYATPKSHTVTAVDGLSEFKTDKAATAFAKKYVALLPGLSSAFEILPSSDPEILLHMVSKDWSVSVTKQHNRFNNMGFHVRISLSAGFHNPLSKQLMDLQAKEKQELKAAAALQAVDKARKGGDLRGL